MLISPFRPKNIYGWNGFELAFKNLTIGITPSIGGRIMSLKIKGHELLYIDQELCGQTIDIKQVSDLAQAKHKLGFRFWGGDKTWVAPQKEWLEGIPPLDLDAGAYELGWENQHAVMTSPICRETGLQIVRRVGVDGDSINIAEELYNRTNKPSAKGLWNVTQIRRPCFFEIPADKGRFRSYHLEDPSLPAFAGDLVPHSGYIKIDCSDASLFKIGGMPNFGQVMIRFPGIDGDICWKKTFLCDTTAQYAHGSALEIFNSPTHPYSEIELHAPFKVLSPGSCIRLMQRWQISS